MFLLFEVLYKTLFWNKNEDYNLLLFIYLIIHSFNEI